jgi:endonuclease/exonuclease/phosphatase family metal-dependent hydrolase
MVALVRGWSSARALTVVTALTVAGCAKAGIPIGSVDADNVALAGSPLFAHYQGVLSGASTVGDLLRNRLAFSGRPTPTALLQSMQAANPPAAPDAVPMSVVSFNVGLLDASLFGVVQYARTPDLEARAELMANAVFAQGYDVLGLQEVWRPADVERFRTAARSAGYWVVASSRAGYTDGLLIAVKTAFAPEPAASEVRFEQFSEISSNEFFPAPGFSRGFLSVRIEHPRLGSIVVYDTHTASFPAAYRLRMSHARELGLHAQRTVRPGELLFVVGDVNAGPYYRADVWNLPNNASEPDWYANTLSYPVLMHYAGVTDLVVRGRTAADATLDITEGDRVPNDPASATRVPFGMAGFCPAVPAAPFTGTDCNALYFQQYAGTEFPARLDHVMGRDTDNRIHVESAPMAFTESVAYGGRMGPLSDHYGQLVRMRIAPRR